MISVILRQAYFFFQPYRSVSNICAKFQGPLTHVSDRDLLRQLSLGHG